MYRLVFSMQARTDWEYWKQSGNTAIIKKITALLKDMTEHPYTWNRKARAVEICPVRVLVKTYKPGTQDCLPCKRN